MNVIDRPAMSDRLIDGDARMESQRLDTLRRMGILDTPPDPKLDRIVAFAQSLFDVPIALVSLVDERRQWFKSVFGLEATETPRCVAFCTHTIQSDDVMVVENAVEDARFAANPLVTGDPNIRFYAGAPLKVANGSRIGTLCVIDRQPREFNEADRSRLAELAEMIVDLLGHDRTRALVGDALLQEDAEDYHYLKRELDALCGGDAALLKLLGDGCSDGLWYKDLETQDSEWISPGFWRLFGYDPAAKPHTVAEWRTIVDKSDLALAQNAAALHVQTPGFVYDQVLRHKHADGHTVWVRSRAVAIRDENGRAIRMLGVHSDISDLKEREEALERQAAQLSTYAQLNQAILDTSQTGIECFDPKRDASGEIVDFIRTVANPAAARLCGRQLDEMYDSCVVNDDSALKIDGYFEILKKVLETGVSIEREVELTDGERVAQYFKLSVGRAALTSVVATFTPVTALKRQQIALKRLHDATSKMKLDVAKLSQELLEIGRDVFDCTHGFASTVIGDKYHVMNLAGEIDAIGVGDVVELKDTLCAAVIVEGGPLAFSKIDNAAKACHPALPESDFTSYIGVPIYVDGTLYGTMSFASATERRRPFSEYDLDLIRVMAQKLATAVELARLHGDLRERSEDLQFIVNNMRARIWYKDDKNRTLRLNRAAAQAMGFDDPAELEDTCNYELFPEMAARYHQDDLEVLDSGEAKRGIVEAFTPRSGASGWVSTDKIPMRLENGQRRLLVVAHDITEMKERERELEILNDSLSDFAFVAAHDLQSPMRRTAMFASILQEALEEEGQELNEEGREALEGIQASVVHMREMVRSLHKLSSVSAGALEFATVDLEEVAEEATTIAGDFVREAGAEVQIGRLPTVQGDNRLLMQVFQNLISNACKYRGEAPPRIRISARLLAEDLAHEIAIEDNGPGIPEEFHDRIFEPFKRLPAAKKTEGVGIGLSLCRRVAGAHGGSLVIDPSYTDGARFLLRLPKRSEGASDD